MDTVKERLIAFLAFKHISKAEFSRMIGVSQAYVTSMRGSMSPDKIHNTALCFPELNIEWLMTGKGEMIRNGAPGVVISGNNRLSNSTIDNRHYYSNSPDVLRAQIDILEERIKEKDAQLEKKDEQIKKKDEQIKQLLDILQTKK